MKLKKLTTLVVTMLVLFALVLTACDSGKTPEQTKVNETEQNGASEPPQSGDQYKVALVLPGTINDEGWNATAYAGLTKIKEDGYDTAFTENVANTDFESVYRGYANAGYNLIIGHGFQFLDPARAVMADYPDTYFAVTSTVEYTDPNVLAVDTNGSDAGFLAGVLAAKMTKTGVVGSPSGLEIPGVLRYVSGFKQGVAYVDPDIVCLTNFTGSSTDSAAVKELAAAMVEQNADVLAPNADQSGVAVFELVKELENVYIIGVYGDQASLAPDQTLSSAIIDMPGAMEAVAKLGAEGKLQAQSYVFGVKEGAVWMTEYHDDVPEDVREYMNDVIEKIKSGEIEVDTSIDQ